MLAIILYFCWAADPRIHVHREQLSAFDQLRIGVCLVILDVQEEPPFTEDMFGVDDAGRFLVLSYECIVEIYGSKSFGLWGATWMRSPGYLHPDLGDPSLFPVLLKEYAS